MLFNSYEFIFGFLPVVLLGFFAIGGRSRTAAAWWLGAASLVFYGWWSVAFVPLLLLSICLNYWFGLRVRPAATPGQTERPRRTVFYAALAFNLGLLALFKYANFFVDNLNAALAVGGLGALPELRIVLPIGISFYTFTQIAFIVDCWQGKVAESRFMHYLLFVTYFPHLIAGPVLHHSQMMPQFATPEIYRPDYDKIARGVAIFTIGLSKKLLIADPLGGYADVLFSAVHQGTVPMFVLSWVGTLSYTFQIYFDFSGYSDMAVGLSLLFGITLPINFNAPYQATSIIDFWRRWHISLSTFLRDYLYVPLGGNRRGTFRRYVNLLITMVLGGLWHGANWTFVLWGTAHGALLTVNHIWRSARGGEASAGGRLGHALGWLVTFVAVCSTWVIFRAERLRDAVSIYRGMLGFNGLSLPPSFEPLMVHVPLPMAVRFNGFWQNLAAVLITECLALLTVAFVISVAVPPFTQTVLQRSSSTFPARFNLGPAIALLFCLCVLSLGRKTVFLYFQF